MNFVVLRNSVALLLLLAAVSAYKSYSGSSWLGKHGAAGAVGVSLLHHSSTPQQHHHALSTSTSSSGSSSSSSTTRCKHLNSSSSSSGGKGAGSTWQKQGGTHLSAWLDKLWPPTPWIAAEAAQLHQPSSSTGSSSSSSSSSSSAGQVPGQSVGTHHGGGAAADSGWLQSRRTAKQRQQQRVPDDSSSSSSSSSSAYLSSSGSAAGSPHQEAPIPGSTSSYTLGSEFKWGYFVALRRYSNAVILWLRLGPNSSSSSSKVAAHGSSSSSSSSSSSEEEDGCDCECAHCTPAEAAATRRAAQDSSSSSQHRGTISSAAVTGSSSSSSRRLLQLGSGTCPAGCKPGSCREVGSAGSGFVCQECLGSLIVNKVTGMCACPSGRFLSAPNTCKDCPRGHYCPGGTYVPATTSPVAEKCPDYMTTVGLRTINIRGCVNLPGYFYSFFADGMMAANPCPADTYGPGFRKQRACVPCPAGFTTNGATKQTHPLQCGVPLGYYLKAPGQAAPCTQGTYKNTTRITAQCTACPTGTTTQREGSTSGDECTVLEPGNYAHRMDGSAIREARTCPQKYWCPGGVPNSAFNPDSPDPSDPTIRACAGGAWTQERGAIAAEQCLTPPGFRGGSGGVVEPCPPNSFRELWLPPFQAGDCSSCGNGVSMDTTERITVFHFNGTTSLMSVGTTSEDCYIQAGQGLYFESTTGQFRVRNCDGGDEYGVSNRTYGLTPSSCRPCPTNMITSTDRTQYPNSASFFTNNGDGTRGFTSLLACVNEPGKGLSGRMSVPCPPGFFNPGDTTGPCQACPEGTTTAGEGLGRRRQDCGIRAGYGLLSGSIQLCAIGTYNDQDYQASLTATCSACPAGTTSSQPGAAAVTDCNLCSPGRGGTGTTCPDTCGGAAGPTYQPALQPAGSPCKACPVQTPGYNFYLQDGSNDVFEISAVAKSGASSTTDCLASFAQIQDGAWWLPLSSTDSVTTSNDTDFAACVSRCTAAIDCQFVTFDYVTSRCSVRVSQEARLVGPPVLGLKAIPSNDLGTLAWSLHANASAINLQQQQQQQSGGVRAKSQASGLYVFYQDPNALAVGTTRRSPAGAASFTKMQDCMSACDDDTSCAGFTIVMRAIAAERPPTCTLIYGDPTPQTYKRTVIRADAARLTPPVIVPP